MPQWTKETFEKRNADKDKCAEEKKNPANEDAGEELMNPSDDPCGKGESENAG